MKEVLEDARLVTLQREGGAVLARMRREEFRFPQSEDYRYQIIFKSSCVLLLVPFRIIYIGTHITITLLSVTVSFHLHCLASTLIKCSLYESTLS